MNDNIRNIFSDSEILKTFNTEEIYIIATFLYEGSKEAFADMLQEKVHDGKCTDETKHQLLLRFEELQQAFRTSLANYTNAVNQAYDESFHALLDTEIQNQKTTLQKAEEQYAFLFSKTV